MNSNLKKLLEDTLDKAFIYSLMLYQAEVHNNRMKMIFKFPLIITGAIFSILNSNFDSEAMKNVNIVFNILSSVILSISVFMQYEAREQEFANTKKKFIKLSSDIEQKLLSNSELDDSYVFACIEKYNTIEENLDFKIEDWILQKTREKWATKKTLPIIINGVAKIREDEPVLKSSIVYNQQPRVLDVKAVEGDNICI
jgi:hypothetical protein